MRSGSPLIGEAFSGVSLGDLESMVRRRCIVCNVVNSKSIPVYLVRALLMIRSCYSW